MVDHADDDFEYRTRSGGVVIASRVYNVCTNLLRNQLGSAGINFHSRLSTPSKEFHACVNSIESHISSRSITEIEKLTNAKAESQIVLYTSVDDFSPVEWKSALRVVVDDLIENYNCKGFVFAARHIFRWTLDTLIASDKNSPRINVTKKNFERQMAYALEFSARTGKIAPYGRGKKIDKASFRLVK